MQIAIPLYDGFTALDAIGPYEVLRYIPDGEVVFCGPEARTYRSDSGVVGLVADQSFGQVTSPEIVVVPGGPGSRELLDPEEPYPSWIAAVHANTTWTTSVCTGSLLLAASGILDGLDATTHWGAREELAALGARPVAERVVVGDGIITAAGVSAGIDMALKLVEELHGPDMSKAVQLAIEYDPDPPHDSGSAEKADPQIVELARGALVSEYRTD